jgi:hypothetical protein
MQLVPMRRRGSVSVERVLLFGIVFPTAVALLALGVRAIVAYVGCAVETLTGPLL